MPTSGEPSPRSVNDLCRLEQMGQCPEFLFFWGHQPRRDGRIGPGCLSQWWPAPFTVDRITYPTAEHFMMARKARIFGDEHMVSRILEAPSPAAAKALGREVHGYDEQLWEANRYGIVVEGNAAKFGQDPALRAYLVTTAGRVLAEASPSDRVWGIGLAADDVRAGQPSSWKGLNLLGFALTEVRESLTGCGEAQQPGDR